MGQARRVSRDLLTEAAQAAQKLTAEEMEGYLRWVLGIARHVAGSAKELGSDTRISPKEAAALEEIERILRSGTPNEDGRRGSGRARWNRRRAAITLATRPGPGSTVSGQCPWRLPGCAGRSGG